MLTTKCYKLYQKFLQSNIFWDHSYNSPNSKRIKRIIKINQEISIEDRVTNKGNNRTNSTSKIKNKIAIRKKWIEKYDRELLWGINPHSKGLSFSWSSYIFFFKENNKTNKINLNLPITITRLVNIKIR